jgi:hypothetical protein
MAFYEVIGLNIINNTYLMYLRQMENSNEDSNSVSTLDNMYNSEIFNDDCLTDDGKNYNKINTSIFEVRIGINSFGVGYCTKPILIFKHPLGFNYLPKKSLYVMFETKKCLYVDKQNEIIIRYSCFATTKCGTKKIVVKNKNKNEYVTKKPFIIVQTNGNIHVNLKDFDKKYESCEFK